MTVFLAFRVSFQFYFYNRLEWSNGSLAFSALVWGRGAADPQ